MIGFVISRVGDGRRMGVDCVWWMVGVCEEMIGDCECLVVRW